MDSEKHILIVDDNIDLCYNLKDIFEDEGYQAEVAHNAVDGLAVLRRQMYDVALLDIRLPDGNGPKFLPAIHQIHPDIPVIVITAYAALNTAVQALKLGAYSYLIKPLDVEEMLITVNRAVEKLHLVQRERKLNKQLNRELAERQRIEAGQERLIAELREALAKVKTLSGILPICASCKKIRDDQDYWHDVAVYVRDHSEAEFSHGLCPDCMKRLYPDYYQDD